MPLWISVCTPVVSVGCYGCVTVTDMWVGESMPHSPVSQRHGDGIHEYVDLKYTQKEGAEVFKHFCEEIPEQSNVRCLVRYP